MQFNSIRYKSKKNIILLWDIVLMLISFICAVSFRYNLLVDFVGLSGFASTYVLFLIICLIIYSGCFLLMHTGRIENMSVKDVVFNVFVQQTLFVVCFILVFFVFHKYDVLSRVVTAVLYFGNIILCSIGRIVYRFYCVSAMESCKESDGDNNSSVNQNVNPEEIRHVYIVGSKSIGLYGGYESFVMNLLLHHKDDSHIKYHVACKANGQGYMELDKLPGAVRINDNEFSYCNANCFMINVPERIGAAQAIYYDIRALGYVCNHIERNHIERPIVYILASRVGPFEKKYVTRIHDAGGLVYQNPDGHEDWRRKWNYLIRKYWKLSERYAVKYADLVICDSRNIEDYIRDEYSEYNPQTTFIAYGSYINPSKLDDIDSKYQSWLSGHGLKDGNFYISVGRFVAENNFEVMIREFMRSNTKKSFAIITTENEKYADELQQKLRYKKDKRIKFVGTVYDTELLGKIRANACGYIHGHEVGGTNPSLLESLGSTNVNLLYDVGFNREVAEDTALYWTKDDGDLARVIEKVDKMTLEDRVLMGDKAKNRIQDEYSWELICNKYRKVFDGSY